MNIWIDLSNSPHPLLFAPIARRLEDRGHRVSVTARDHAQTLALARERWDDVSVFATDSPYGRVAKGRAMAARIGALRQWARVRPPDVALSHNSYGQIVAARSIGIPVVTAMDYEHQPVNHLAFRLANSILLPAELPVDLVRRFGATKRKTRHYAGFKEEVYVGDFEFDRTITAKLGLSLGPNDVLVVARTAPSRATYHHFDNPGFVEILQRLSRNQNVNIVVLPRFQQEGETIRRLHLPRVAVSSHAVDARSLMVAADLVVGGGGTMTREAALLGVPVVSVYAGERPAVDRALEHRGLLRYLDNPAELPVPTRRKRDPDALVALRKRGHAIVETFVQVTEMTAEGRLRIVRRRRRPDRS